MKENGEFSGVTMENALLEKYQMDSRDDAVRFLIGLFIIDIRITILVLLFVPIKCVVMKYFAKKQKQIMDEFIKRNQKYAKWFGDTVGGVREVKLFNIFDRKHEEFDQNQKDIIEKQKQMNMPGQWNTITDSLVPFSARGIDDMCQMFILKTNFQVR